MIYTANLISKDHFMGRKNVIKGLKNSKDVPTAPEHL